MLVIIPCPTDHAGSQDNTVSQGPGREFPDGFGDSRALLRCSWKFQEPCWGWGAVREADEPQGEGAAKGKEQPTTLTAAIGDWCSRWFSWREPHATPGLAEEQGGATALRPTEHSSGHQALPHAPHTHRLTGPHSCPVRWAVLSSPLSGSETKAQRLSVTGPTAHS